jgi:hypothetical protein
MPPWSCTRASSSQGDEVELNEQDGKRLWRASVLEEASKSKRRASKKQV